MTETFLLGRSLADDETMQGALTALQSEVVPTPDPAEADPAYRRSLACALLYKVCISNTVSGTYCAVAELNVFER